MLKRVLLCVTARSSVPRDRGTAQARLDESSRRGGRSLPSVTSKGEVAGSAAPPSPRCRRRRSAEEPDGLQRARPDDSLTTVSSGADPWSGGSWSTSLSEPSTSLIGMSSAMTLHTVTTAIVRPGRGVTAAAALRIVAAAADRLQSWAVTTEGRHRTGLALRSLDGAAWRIARHIRLPDGSQADHLVTGPTGAYLLDSRAWRGMVTVDHKGATITPAGRPEAAWTARGQHSSLAPAAAALGRISSAVGDRLPTPRAVVVVWATFPERLALSGGITYVAGDHLVEWLSDQARRSSRQVPVAPNAGVPVRSLPARSPTWAARARPGRTAAPMTVECRPDAESRR